MIVQGRLILFVQPVFGTISQSVRWSREEVVELEEARADMRSGCQRLPLAQVILLYSLVRAIDPSGYGSNSEYSHVEVTEMLLRES